MNRTFIPILIAVIAITLFTANIALAEEKSVDKVVLLDGSVVSGKIISENWEKIVCGSRTVETIKVAHITYYDTPPDYIEAVDLIEREQYDNASFKLKLALDQPGVRDWIKMGVAMQLADIAWRMAKWEDARKQYRDFISKNADSRFVREATWRIAQSLLNEKDYQNAEGAFDNIFKDNRFANEPIHWRAKFWEIYTLEVRDKYQDAYSQYLDTKNKVFNSLSQAAKDAFFFDRNPLPEDREMIQLHIECTFRGLLNQALSGKIDEAFDEFDKLAKKPTKSLSSIGSIGIAICDVIKISNMAEIDEKAVLMLSKARLSLAKNLIYTASTDDRRADIFYWSGRAALLADDIMSAKVYFSMVTGRLNNTLVARLCEEELAKLQSGKDAKPVEE